MGFVITDAKLRMKGDWGTLTSEQQKMPWDEYTIHSVGHGAYLNHSIARHLN